MPLAVQLQQHLALRLKLVDTVIRQTDLEHRQGLSMTRTALHGFK
jgi:hypothetical protein